MALKDLRPALRAFLLADSAVSAAVGGSRIYPGKMPQGQTSPSLVYSEISGVGDHHMQGPSGLARPRIQITAWAQTADLANDLYLKVKERLDGYQGVMGSGSAEVTVQGVFIESWRENDDEAANLRGKIADYFIAYEER